MHGTSFKRSPKLDGVCYDIRGPVLDEANRLEAAGHTILKLNIGNPAPFGFMPPDEVSTDVVRNLQYAAGYVDSQGLFAARKAVVQYYQTKGVMDLDIDQVFIGNGVSELIVMAMQALLDTDDEVLIPAPDYPLWTAATRLAGGNPVHYPCDEAQHWRPDFEALQANLSEKTRALVLINPNNPTGAVYDEQTVIALCEFARANRLILFADEIYDKILYDECIHQHAMLHATDMVSVTFSGLSKNYRAAGYRVGWMVVRDPLAQATDYQQGLKILASMRLCSNVPAQFAVQTSLMGFQSIQTLVQPGGRLRTQRDLAWQRVNAIPGLSCVKPQGALYVFVRIDREIYPIVDDEGLMLQILRQEKILLVHGRGFNWPTPDHFRIVFLPHVEQLNQAFDGLERFFARLRAQTPNEPKE